MKSCSICERGIDPVEVILNERCGGGKIACLRCAIGEPAENELTAMSVEFSNFTRRRIQPTEFLNVAIAVLLERKESEEPWRQLAERAMRAYLSETRRWEKMANIGETLGADAVSSLARPMPTYSLEAAERAFGPPETWDSRTAIGVLLGLEAREFLDDVIAKADAKADKFGSGRKRDRALLLQEPSE